MLLPPFRDGRDGRAGRDGASSAYPVAAATLRAEPGTVVDLHVARYHGRPHRPGGRRLITVPLDEATMADELRVFVQWYNDARPHRALRGDTPNEVYFGRSRARDGPRFEVRGRYPIREATPATLAEIPAALVGLDRITRNM